MDVCGPDWARIAAIRARRATSSTAWEAPGGRREHHDAAFLRMGQTLTTAQQPGSRTSRMPTVVGPRIRPLLVGMSLVVLASALAACGGSPTPSRTKTVTATPIATPGTTSPVGTATTATSTASETGTATPTGAPSLSPTSRVLAIAGGQFHSCALLRVGTVKCWGSNAGGALGNGRLSAANPTPVTAIGIRGATAITAGGNPTAFGYQDSCALLAGGTVTCWGANGGGQLGNPAIPRNQSTVPVHVIGISDATEISANEFHACALLPGGTVKCWGSNASGMLGVGTNTPLSATPVTVAGLSGVAAVATGYLHTCALLSAGTVKCWGSNGSGMLGNTGITSYSSKPVDVTGLTGVTAIAVGSSHACALLVAGTVECWGNASTGALGNGDTTRAFSPTPVPVAGLSGVSAITASSSHSCALLAVGTVWCWGGNANGQLGPSHPVGVSTSTPLPVGTLSGVSAISAAENHTCALLASGTVSCWGNNTDGELGGGSSDTNSSTPVNVTGL
jgi:alpha-tubulin suppressor-like RCC1 family protein